VQVVLGITGGFFLLRLAWLALSEAFARRRASPGHASPSRGDFATGLVFGLANPVGLAFWSGLGTSVALWGATGWGFALFFAGFCLGAVFWTIGISAAVRWGRRWVHPAFFRWINALCGLALGYFGIRVLWSTVQAWLEHQLAPAAETIR
jgi:threonine/homoserine/homoserine lactone efflux protein